MCHGHLVRLCYWKYGCKWTGKESYSSFIMQQLIVHPLEMLHFLAWKLWLWTKNDSGGFAVKVTVPAQDGDRKSFTIGSKGEVDPPPRLCFLSLGSRLPAAEAAAETTPAHFIKASPCTGLKFAFFSQELAHSAKPQDAAEEHVRNSWEKHAPTKPKQINR